MLTANLVGFVIGTDGISYMVGQLTDSWEGARDNYGAIPHTTSVAEFDFVHRISIHSLYVFLSVCWRTDHVRVQVRPISITPRYGYTQIFTLLGRKSCVLGL